MVQDMVALEPVKVGSTNCYPIDTDQGLILIDTGTNSDALWETLVKGLKELGHDVSDARLVLLTHSHSDHSGLAERVRNASGAKIAIHREDAAYLSYNQSKRTLNRRNMHDLMIASGVPETMLEWFYSGARRGDIWPKNWRQAEPLFGPAPDYAIRLEALSAHSYKEAHPEEESPHFQHKGHVHTGGHGELPVGGVNFVPDFTFEDDEDMSLGDATLRAVHTPGHTPGHCCFYHEASGAVFTGDHILKRITPNPGIHFHDEDSEKRFHSLPEYLRSLRKVLDLNAKRVLPAHEEEIYDLPASVERLEHHHDRRSEKVLEAVVEGRYRPFEIMPHVFPALRAFALIPAMAEVIGHLDILEESGSVKVESRDGNIFYSLIDDRVAGRA